MRTLQAVITSGINAAGVTTPGQVVIGWPTASEGSGIWGAGQWLISLFPEQARNASRYKPGPGYVVLPTPATLVATVTTPSASASVITLTGSNQAGLNIHTVVGPRQGQLDTLYQTAGTESLSALATAIAARVNALSLSGITATPSAATVTITGSAPVWCNVGLPLSANPPTGYPIYVSEIGRFRRDIQVTVWAAEPDNTANSSDATRENLENSMLFGLGGTDQPYQMAPDGSAFSALWRSADDWDDKAESAYSVFKSVNFLEIEYGLLKPVAATPIGVVDLALSLTTQYAATDPLTQIIGGP